MTQNTSYSQGRTLFVQSVDMVDAIIDFMHNTLSHVLMLGIRIYIGWKFFISGYLSLSPWESNVFLYEYEYIPNIAKNSGIDLSFMSPNTMAFAGTAGELILPLLLWLGLTTRFAAAGLIVMAGVIQLTYPEHGETHYAWMLLLAIIACKGGGKLAADHLIAPKLGFTIRHKP